MLIPALLLFIALALKTNAAFYYPTPQAYLLEHILVDNWGAYATNFSSAITPCTNYVSQTGSIGANSGRTTAAQWMRVLFHDFVTANMSAGTGGVDASIGFETEREENSGSAFNDSFAFWRPFVNDEVSMADLVALGTVMSNNLCGGKTMEYRPGRIDAVAADPTTGVPAPETDLEETLLFFERAGFDRADSIGLTACGHTLGSVHHGGFPNVVDESAVTPNNSNGGINFDTTHGAFDPLVVSEYLSWTGNKGGPLVTTNNITTRSDLRLYESDNNATMQTLLSQGDGFLDTCTELFERAMSTVPSAVKLNGPIVVEDVKPYNVTYDFEDNGTLKMSGNVRVLTPAGTESPSTLTLRIAGHEWTLHPEGQTGTSVFGREASTYGTTTYFPFSLSGDAVRGARDFVIANQTFALQSDVILVPSLTTVAGTGVNATLAVSASHSCSDIALRIAVPVTQQGTLSPKIVRMEERFTAMQGELTDYQLCYGAVKLDGLPTGLISLKAINDGEVVDTLLVNGGAAGW